MILAQDCICEPAARITLVRSVQALLKTPRRIAQEIRNVDAIWTLATSASAETGEIPLLGFGIWIQLEIPSEFETRSLNSYLILNSYFV
jgi:hypothetical protein